MTNLQAALGVGELENINKNLRIKSRMAYIYNKVLENISGIKLPVTKLNVKNVYWMYAILVNEEKFGISKNQLRQRLLKRGIDTRDFFYSPKDQPVLAKYIERDESFPITDKISKEGMYLPSGLALTYAQQKKVINTILDIRDSLSV